MSKNLQTFGAVAGILGFLLAGVAIFQALRPKDDPDQPITMAGGSLKVKSGPWAVSSGDALYSANLHSISRIAFTCDMDEPTSEYTTDDNFTITFRYEKNNSQYHRYIMKYSSSDPATRRLKIESFKNATTNKVPDLVLDLFFNMGDHPHTKWEVASIESTGLRQSGSPAQINCGTDAKSFYMNVAMTR